MPTTNRIGAYFTGLDRAHADWAYTEVIGAIYQQAGVSPLYGARVVLDRIRVKAGQKLLMCGVPRHEWGRPKSECEGSK